MEGLRLPSRNVNGFLLRSRCRRLLRCLEVDRYLNIVANENSALVESLVPADPVVLAVQPAPHHEGEARISISVLGRAAELNRQLDRFRDTVQREVANNLI